MFKVNEDKSIYITRGDAASFAFSAMEGESNYIFRSGDVVRLNVFERKACECIVLQKDFTPEAGSYTVDIVLTGEDTKIGETISKPVDYWYEIELNPDTYPQTIIGYDEGGEKVFRLYPEGGDLK